MSCTYTKQEEKNSCFSLAYIVGNLSYEIIKKEKKSEEKSLVKCFHYYNFNTSMSDA